MANNFNSIADVGNLTREPELRFTPAGAAVTNFGIAVNRSWKKDDEWQEETSFFDVTVWREQAENVAESLNKGDRVTVVGRLEQRSWETTEGERRSKVEIQADEVGAALRFATVEVKRNERKSDTRKPTTTKPATPAVDYSSEPF